MSSGSRTAQLRKKIFSIIDVNSNDGFWNRFYDFFSTGILILNIIVVVLNTFPELSEKNGFIFDTIEALTVAFFALDCFLRIWTAKYQYPQKKEGAAIRKYLLSFDGIIDILSFVPYYLPAFIPSGAVVFRFFRVVRIFRLFRVNAYYDSLNVITDVLRSKKNQLISSVFIILVLMVASSLCMYSIENTAQPDVFSNAFSGIWWAVSTLLTIGYGDIYPITFLGQVFGTVISFLGVGMIAIPTGIISAGFVEQYSHIKRLSDLGEEAELNFIKIHIMPNDPWAGKMIKDLQLPAESIISVILRGNEVIIPKGDVVLLPQDSIVLGAQSFKDDLHIELKEITLGQHNPWIGQMIRDLDLSRRTLIVAIKRGGSTLIPKGSLVLLEGDKLLLYSTQHISAIRSKVSL